MDQLIPEPWQLTLIYGSPTPSNRHQFWDCIASVGQTFQGAWFIYRDFNMVFNQKDKKGGTPVENSSNGGYNATINNLRLIDVGFVGNLYTWTNRRKGSANIQERLDRGFSNVQWKIRFQEATLIHLQEIHSDHRPLLIHMEIAGPSQPKSFKFEAMWTTYPATGFVINEAWNRSTSFLSD